MNAAENEEFIVRLSASMARNKRILDRLAEGDASAAKGSRTCVRCGEHVKLDSRKKPDSHRVHRICGCAEGPLWTARPHMDHLLMQLREAEDTQ